MQPRSGDCNPIQNKTSWSHALIYKTADKNCSAEYIKFLFDDDGKIYHKCSGKIVCTVGKKRIVCFAYSLTSSSRPSGVFYSFVIHFYYVWLLSENQFPVRLGKLVLEDTCSDDSANHRR